jgi:hypothetical protein
MSTRASTRRGAIIATVANPAATAATRKPPRKSTKATKPEKPQPKVSKMAKAKSTKAKKKAPRRSNPSAENPRGMVSIPRGMMLVPVARNPAKKKSGHRPKRRNPEEPPHHAMLKNGAAAVGFGTLAATVGMLGGYALGKANIKNKFANVAANVATGAIVGGGVGMLDRTAGTVVAHNYMVAAGQWLSAPDASSTTSQAQVRGALGAGRSAAASPAMLNRQPAAAMHGVEEPDPEAITAPHPAPQQRRTYARPVGGPLDQLGGYRGVSGLGTPLDNLGSPLDNLGGYDHVEGVIADDVGEFDHLHGIIADNLGDELEELGGDEDHLDAVMADDLGDDELAASDDMDGSDDELGFLRA